ncbi:ASKHA domain-containing protein [Congregicoccus parvus]|uniref:ASKHA domain-containing protein n=1 Tax=Congregicoccus parvus TaxID=3081749 RepID=UPI003FA5CD70
MSTRLQLDGASLSPERNESIFAAAARVGISLPSSCKGLGKCRECLVEVASGAGALSAPTPEEKHLRDGFRLACRCTCIADTTIEVRLHSMRRGSMRIETGGTGAPAGDLRPAVVRAGEKILLDGLEIARTSGPLHGLAIDLGTTTVVVRCHDLETGAVVATTAFENPQRFGGSDVMARIQFDTDNPGRLLQRTLLGYLGRAIEGLPVDPRSIFEVVVAGNTTMRDLFFGLDVHSIGQRPYRSLTENERRAGTRSTTALATTARSLRLPVHPAARVYGLPLVSGHVGADAAACLLALAPHESDRLVAIMDIGTNTELFLGRRGRLLAASCPAGPAFEGRAVTHGMPGLDGAISRVRIDDAGTCRIEVIGGGAPEGICGSGLVDALSELVRTERMNAMGRFEDGAESYPLLPDGSIFLHERDINELAQAKGANVAGLLTVAKRFGCALADIECFHLAGGFGRHLDLAAARRIGLVPDLPDVRIHQAGNAAIEGATIALLSVEKRRELEALVDTIEHVELETDPDFFDHFVFGCQFRRVGVSEEVWS